MHAHFGIGTAGDPYKASPYTLLFKVPVTIGDTTIMMAVDTGATMTILTPRDAGRVAQHLRYEGAANGAGITGVAVLPIVRARRVVVANRDLGTRTMLIGHDGIGISLLGQTELRSLGEINIRGNVMTIGTKSDRPDQGS